MTQDSVGKNRILKLNQACAVTLLPAPRPADSHKGLFGSVGIIGGAAGMVGAAFLAGTAALKLGAGRVYLGLISDNAPSMDPEQPELMLRPVHELFKLDHLSCLVVGPGLGMSVDASFWLACALESALPIVLDADALNLIAAQPRLAKLLRERKAPALLTPHATEAARLLGTDSATIQHDRMPLRQIWQSVSTAVSCSKELAAFAYCPMASAI
mgnify:CR=1 FL=1